MNGLSGTDLIFLAILLLCAFLGARRGAIKAISGIVSTLTSVLGAFYLTPRMTSTTTRLIMPVVGRAVNHAAEKLGMSALLSAPAVESVREDCLKLLSALGIGKQAGEGILTSGAGEQVASVAKNALSQLLAPGITFVVLLIIIKLVVSLVLRLLGMNIPILSTLNHGAGFLLGLLSGAVLVLAICWGGFRYAPQEGSVFSVHALQESRTGVWVAPLFEAK